MKIWQRKKSQKKKRTTKAEAMYTGKSEEIAVILTLSGIRSKQ